MYGSKLTRKGMDALLKKYDRGGACWSIRKEQVPCAADSGDSGWREVYNNGERDIAAVEYPKARYCVKVVSLVDQ